MRWLSQKLYLVALVFLAHPILSSAAPAPIVSQDFGTVAINGSSPGSAAITYQASGLSQNPTFRLQYGSDFSLATTSCTGTATITCTLQVNFSPKFPGLRQDAIRVSDSSSNNLLETIFLHGIGSGPQALLGPGLISTFAGIHATSANSGDNGPATSATFGELQGLAVDTLGNVYIVDSLYNVIRKVDGATNVITTVVGNGSPAYSGDNGPATNASLNTPSGIALDAAGNLYIADSGNNLVRKVDAASGIITTVAGHGSGSLGDNGPAVSASLSNPSDVAVDTAGNLYIADTLNNRIRKVDLSGTITTVAGGTPTPGPDGLGNGGLATNAQLSRPYGITLDFSGNLYIADTYNHLIREVNNGIISVVAGNGNPYYSGDGGAAINASLNTPKAVRVDAAGNLYIADTNNFVIREVNEAGIISTIAGLGREGFTGNGGLAVGAQMYPPSALAIDSKGNIYLADTGNNVVRWITPWTGSLNFSTTQIGQVSTPQILSILNIGNQALNLTALALNGNFIQQSSGAVDCSTASSIGPTLACTFALAFAPQSVGAQNGSLTFTTNSGSNRAVNLTGTATGTAGSDPVVSATTLTFTNQTIGSTSAAQVITLSNPGSSALTIANIWLSGSNTADFSMSQKTCGTVLNAQSSCTLSVTFIPTPIAAGIRSTTLVLTEVGTSSSFTQSVFLSGTVNVPQPVVSPASLSFNQAVGVPSVVRIVTLANRSAVLLSITGISLSGPAEFQITSNTCGSTLTGGNSCTLTIVFTPQVVGVETAALTFTNSAFNSPQTVTLQGIGGIPQLSFINGAAPVNLGTIALNTASTVRIPVSNVGTANSAISRIEVTGVNSSDFLQSNDCGTSIAPAALCTISIVFTPTGVGTRNALLTMSIDISGAPQTLPLTGTVLSPASFVAARSGDVHATGDYDGDGKVDFAVWRPASGFWFVIPSSNPSAPIVQQWGLPGDIPVPGDYDGDGKVDFAVWRPASGFWFVIPSSNPSAPIVQQWGLPGDIPVPGDYDGDGKVDFAVWRPASGFWFVIPSSNPSAPIVQQWGLPGDIPVPGDYDGDGKVDFAVWRPASGFWFVIPSSNPSAPIVQQWGLPGDIPVPGDYDGDGKVDFAVWRPASGFWFVIPSSNPSAPIVQQWGLPGDIPLLGNYDGDGKIDFTVWRPASGFWFVIPSSNPSAPTVQQWGLSGDIPS